MENCFAEAISEAGSIRVTDGEEGLHLGYMLEAEQKHHISLFSSGLLSCLDAVT